MKLLSWNVAFGSPFRRRGREQEVRAWLADAAAEVDVLLLQEATPTLLAGHDEWSVRHATPNGPHGSCVLVACRRPARLDPVELVPPSRNPQARSYCLAAADVADEGQVLRWLSLYVPWRSSSASWVQQLTAASFPWPLPAVIGADMNSPVGPRASSHGFIQAATTNGWRHATPLHGQGASHRRSHIDHVLLRGLTATSWSIDRTVIAAGLSDHGICRLALEVDEVTDSLELVETASGRVLGVADLLPSGDVLVDEGTRAVAEQAGITGESVWGRLCRLGNGYVHARRRRPERPADGQVDGTTL